MSLAEKYAPLDISEGKRKIQVDVINNLVNEILVKEITKEIRDDLIERAENYIIFNCQENFRNLLKTGPF